MAITINFNEISLSDKPVFNAYLRGRRRELITYCFTNFYLWRNWDPFTWAKVDNALVVKSGPPELETICVPIASEDRAVLDATETMIDWFASRHRDFKMSEVSAADIVFFERYWPGRFSVKEDPGEANYIYFQNALATLPGKKYHAKRNYLHRFEKKYPKYRLVPLVETMIDRCRAQLADWNRRHDMDDFDLAQEYRGNTDALDHLTKLDCNGAALLIEDKVVAFAVGEPLNADTYCIHIEKGDITITGVYQAINYFYTREYTEGYTYINRAEDMGKPGLIRAKRSYHPCRMEKKYCLRLR